MAGKILGLVGASRDTLSIVIKDANRLQVELLLATTFADLKNSCKEVVSFDLMNTLEEMCLAVDIQITSKIPPLRLVAAI